MHATCHILCSFARTVISIGFAAVFALAPEKVSMLYTLHLVRSCGGVKAVFSQKDGLQVTEVLQSFSYVFLPAVLTVTVMGS